MSLLALWKAAVADRSNFLERVFALLEENGIRYCVIGGVGLNAYVEPVFTAGLDIVVATDQLEETRRLAERDFEVRDFPCSINVYDPDSKLQVQFQRRPEMAAYLERAERREVLGILMPVASPLDLLRAKSEAALDPGRRPSKRGKDALDLARLVTAFPELERELPPALHDRVMEMVDRD